MQVAQATLAALGDQRLGTIVGEVGNDLAGLEVADYGADRHAQHHVVATLAVAVRTAAVLAALRAKDPRVAKIDQRVEIAVGNRIDAAAATAVAAIRSALRNEFLAAERGDAVAAVAGNNLDLGFVEEFHFGLECGVRNEKPCLGGQGFWCVEAGLRGRNDAHGTPTARALDGELHGAVDLCEQRVILADADIVAGVELGATLAHDDAAGD